MKKKQYQPSVMRVYELRHRATLLSGSAPKAPSNSQMGGFQGRHNLIIEEENPFEDE